MGPHSLPEQTLEEAFRWPERAVNVLLQYAEAQPDMANSVLLDKAHTDISASSWCSGLGTGEWAFSMLTGALAKRGQPAIASAVSQAGQPVLQKTFSSAPALHQRARPDEALRPPTWLRHNDECTRGHAACSRRRTRAHLRGRARCVPEEGQGIRRQAMQRVWGTRGLGALCSYVNVCFGLPKNSMNLNEKRTWLEAARTPREELGRPPHVHYRVQARWTAKLRET